jgi:hypothetical protein
MQNNLKYLILGIAFLWNMNSLFAWTSSNEGVCYTMDTLVQLSPDISYNTNDEMYEVDCDIIILDNDTLLISPGETVHFFDYWGTNRYDIVIYGCILAIGSENQPITLGDPECTLSSGDWWGGILFFNTSQNGESILKYCDFMGITNTSTEYETAILCINASPMIDHCSFTYMGSGSETGGSSAIGLLEESFPHISYSTFSYFHNGIAIWSNVYWYHDSINGPNPLIYGCNFSGIGGFFGYGCDLDYVVIWGGFLDNCYFWNSWYNCADTTLGYPLDTIGDGIKTTTSTMDKGKFLLVDGVVNPRSNPIITGINETETDILPTTTKFLVFKNNYPNPFTNHTTIEFEIKKEKSSVNLLVLDSKGNPVKTLLSNQTFSKGKHEVKWFGDNDAGQKVPEGIYFYKLVSGNELLVKKAIVVK